MRVFLAMMMLVMGVAMMGCASVSEDGRRFTAGDEDWGVDVLLDEEYVPEAVYIEGPPDEDMIGDWEAHTGTTPDGRDYVSFERLEVPDAAVE